MSFLPEAFTSARVLVEPDPWNMGEYRDESLVVKYRRIPAYLAKQRQVIDDASMQYISPERLLEHGGW
jgi:hypothetical protein